MGNKSLLNTASGGLFGSTPERVKMPKAGEAAAAEQAAADEAARRLRAQERTRAGASASMQSGVSNAQFAGMNTAKKKLG